MYGFRAKAPVRRREVVIPNRFRGTKCHASTRRLACTPSGESCTLYLTVMARDCTGFQDKINRSKKEVPYWRIFLELLKVLTAMVYTVAVGIAVVQTGLFKIAPKPLLWPSCRLAQLIFSG